MLIISQSKVGYVITVTGPEMANILGFPGVNASGYAPPTEGQSLSVPTFSADAAKLKALLAPLRSAVTDLDAALKALGS